MSNRVLYFPYINVPDSVWFTRMLLYWDVVGAIVPHDFIYHPEKLDKHTRSLVEAELVRQVMPGAYLWEIPSFTEAFIGYLNSLGTDTIEKRIAAFKRGENFSIHIEKMEGLEFRLEKMGVAQMKKYPWYTVEKTTAKEFMAYLAASLGKLENLNFTPVSDDPANLETFIFSGKDTDSPEKKLSPLRIEILEDLFPAPAVPLKASEISRFKEKHRDQLVRFRRRVEKELIDIADITDPGLRERRLQLFKEETEDATKEIKSALNKSGFKRLTLGKIGTILSAVPGVPNVVGLAKAVFDAFEKPKITSLDVSLLYAAYAQKEILHN